MDSLRGQFGTADYGDDERDYDYGDDDAGREAPPSPVGQDERRMQVRAYNHWTSLLGDRNFPAIEDLDPESLTDFGPYSVLLDFSTGIEDPAIQYLGDQLAAECGATEEYARLSDVPSRSLLSRITDHYLQILANQAPIGFEAEFVNQRGATILYRGILLPYSSDDDTIDFIYGVINWKEMADQLTADELLLEIDQALDSESDVAAVREPDPVTDWADGPAADIASLRPTNDDWADEPADSPFPSPSFGADLLGGYEDDDEEGEDDSDSSAPYASLLPSSGPVGGKKQALSLEGYDAGDSHEAVHSGPFAVDPFETDFAQRPDVAAEALPPSDYAEESFVPAAFAGARDEELGLYDCLAAARELAQAARSCEDRSRNALYAAVGRAYDFSLAAEAAPQEFGELVA
ncbi:MAG: PAS domain-containing protein, partial [Tsuneonella sp.]